MIKLMDLISEDGSGRTQTINSKTALNKLLTTSFSEAYKLDETSEVGLYRGLRNHVGDIAYTDPTKIERISRDTNNFYTILLSILPSWKNYPKRSFSVIALLSDNSGAAKDATYEYGKWMYRLMPKNGARFAVSSTKDAFHSFVNVKQRLDMDIDEFSSNIPRYLTKLLNDKGIFKAFDYDYNSISKIIKYWDENVTKKMVLTGDLGSQTHAATNFKEDVEKNFNDSWLNYFDYLLSPTKNQIRLMSIAEIYSLTGATVEVWTDSPCILILQ